MHDQQHAHRHAHRHVHASMRLAVPARGGRPLQRLDRRRFLTELGRNTFAVAILGGFATSCTDDDAAPLLTEPDIEPVAAPDTPDTAPAAETASEPGTDPAAEPAGLQWAQVSLGFVSAYVLVRGNEAAVVDTGTSGSLDAIGETLGTLGANLDDVRHVVLTHHHGDHIGSLPEVVGAAPDAVAYAGAADIASISGADLTAVGDGDDVFGLQVIETPGHTPGSISLLDPGIGLLIAGDALNGDDAGTVISGPNAQFTADLATAEQSVAKLAELTFDAAVFGHGQPVVGGADEQVRALVG